MVIHVGFVTLVVYLMLTMIFAFDRACAATPPLSRALAESVANRYVLKFKSPSVWRGRLRLLFGHYPLDEQFVPNRYDNTITRSGYAHWTHARWQFLREAREHGLRLDPLEVMMADMSREHYERRYNRIVKKKTR